MTTMTEEHTEVAYDVVDDEVGTTDRRRLAVIGVVAALLLAAAGYFLLGGGDSDESSALPPIKRTVKPITVTKPVKKPAAVLPPVSTVKLGRDPFHPLYVAPAPGPAAGSGTATGGTSTSSGGTSTGSTGSTGGTGTTSGPASQPTAKPAPANYALRLSRVEGGGSDLTARFLIGQAGKIQYARAGSVFGRSAEIRLLSIQKGPNGSGTAVIQVGDGSPFDISTGDAAIYVQ